MKILVVEDDAVARNALIDMLHYKRYTVDGAASAEEAIEKLPGDYDLIISDILLDGMDGVSLLNRVKRMDLGIPVVMITGYGVAEMEEKCERNGAAGFLKKPFTVQSLLGLLEEVLKRP